MVDFIILAWVVVHLILAIIEFCYLKEKKKDKIKDIDVVHKECLKGENNETCN